MAAGRRSEVRIGVALVLSWLAFTASVIWRSHSGVFNAWFDVGLYDVPFGIAAAACFRRAARLEPACGAWRTLGWGLVVFIAGNIYGSLVVGDKDIYPSPADAMWLLFYVLVYVAIVQFAKARMLRFYPSTWLDGSIAGLGAAALVVAFALSPVLAQTDGRLSVVATNLAYPTAEILLIVALVGVGVVQRNRAWSWWSLTVGVGTFLVGDVIYLFQESTDSYHEGGLLDISWPLAVVFIGIGACATGDDSVAGAGAAESRQRFMVPGLFVVTSVGLLVVGQRHHVHMVAIILAVASIAAAATRTMLTVREVKALAESRREARTDVLTGVPNRRAFIEQLEAATGTATQKAVMIIDLDGFKDINDSLGHDAGDELLGLVAVRLADLFGDGTLSRLGGDEFGALVSVTGTEDAVAWAGRVTTALETPFALAGMTVRIGASIGIALSPLHGRRRSELLRFADVAMYQAKRNRSVFEVYDPAHDPNTIDRLRTVNELRMAIEQRRLELHYQPTIDMASGRVHGMEALVRWPRADGSLHYPDSFIPLAESTGLIHQLTRAVLDQAISFQAELERTMPGLEMSVNISGQDLIDEGLVAYVRKLLAIYAMPAEQLTLEITEGAVVADPVRAERHIAAFRELGVRVSIDDFGVGYSSMAQLVGLTVDELKIDKGFVMKLDVDERMESIVRATIDLGHALDLTLVAEGVENAASLAILQRLGCDVAQGYHIARPLSTERLRVFLTDRDAERIPPDPPVAANSRALAARI